MTESDLRKGSPSVADMAELASRLRAMSFRLLARMYLPGNKLFVFRVRKTAAGVITEGISRRYTAIVLIGLAGEDEEAVRSIIGGHTLREVCARLGSDIASIDNLGDVALTSWAAEAVALEERDRIRARIAQLEPASRSYPTVEVAWALKALCTGRPADAGPLPHRLAERLMTEFNPASGMFPHRLGGSGGFRAHVSCFADLVYPIQALAAYHVWAGDGKALDVSAQCASRICKLQGTNGQWWWHYDYRTGDVIEGYPVYSVHQDAMAPMALFELRDAGGPDYSAFIQKGLHWIAHAPEIGGPLIDAHEQVVWRKVTHREPGKLCRYLQATASRVHPSLRVPALNVIFPPTAVDYESRPYHFGWLLHAFPKGRAC
jgi:hypothetical protein